MAAEVLKAGYAVGRGLDQTCLFIEPRVINAAQAVQETVGAVVFLALGALIGAADIAAAMTIGNHPRLRQAALNLADGASESSSKAYLYMMRSFNPNAKLLSTSKFDSDPWRKERLESFGRSDYALGCMTNNTPTLLLFFTQKQQEIMNKLHDSSWWVNRSITTRLTAAVGTVAAMASGTAVLILGAVGGAFLLFTCGKYPDCTTGSYDNLKVPGWMLNQLHLGILRTLRPGLLLSQQPRIS